MSLAVRQNLVAAYRSPLGQAVLHMVKQYLRDRYLETIRRGVGRDLHCIKQRFE